jgi:TP901-1 family phage major tail protein
MTAQKGKDLLVKIADGSGYTTVAGLRTRRLAFNAESVDITHAESVNRWRELLDGAGVKRASISGRGLFKDAASDALLRQAFFNGSVVGYQIVIPTFGTVQGPFQIAGLEFAGEHHGVNSGLGRSGKVLRRMLSLPANSSLDAVIAAADTSDHQSLVSSICDERLHFLQSLKTWPVFGVGWGCRVAEVRSAALAMAANTFKARVAMRG